MSAAAASLQSPAQVDDAVDADLEDAKPAAGTGAGAKKGASNKKKKAASQNGDEAAPPSKKEAPAAPPKAAGDVAFDSKHAHKAKKVKL